MAKVRRHLAKSITLPVAADGLSNPCEAVVEPGRAQPAAANWGTKVEPGPAVVMPTVVRVGHVRPDAKVWPTRRHSHPEHHEFIVVLSGAIQVRMAGQRYHAEKGQVLFYPRAVAHEEFSVGAGPLETIFIGWSCDEIDTTSWPVVGHDRRERIQGLARWMFELNTQDTPDNATIRGLLLGVIAEFGVQQTHEEIQAIDLVRRIMQDHLADRLRLEDLAAQAHLSRTHFVRVFTRATGTTPMRYLSRLRVDQARNLILTTRLPMKQVARAVGFPDEFQLSRVFKRVTGRTPSSYRRP